MLQEVQSNDYGELQLVIDDLFRDTRFADRLSLLILAEAHDLPADLLEIVNLLPPGNYTRPRMCDQLNSAITAHGWSNLYGIVA